MVVVVGILLNLPKFGTFSFRKGEKSSLLFLEYSIYSLKRDLLSVNPFFGWILRKLYSLYLG